MNYSNDLANSSIRSSFYAQRWVLAASGNSNFAYWVGGNSSLPAPIDTRSIVERLDYSNDTVNTTTRGPLNAILRQNSATSSHSFGGTPNSSFASNFTFPTVPNAGYFGGGNPGPRASIDKVDYANDTATASVRSALSSARTTLAAIGNFNFGYFAGNNSIVDRLEYSSDTQNTTVRGPLQVGSTSRAAVGNQSYGYVSGGSAVNRIDYSNDSSTSNRGNLLNANFPFGWSSISSPYYGYFTGGYLSPTTYSGLDRIDFANDTLTASKRTNVPNISYGMSGFGNQSFGYIGGGVNLSLVRRVDYSNDTANISFRGPLSKASNYLSSATSNSNFGYFGGGTAPASPITSQVERINYSNDTAVASIRGPLSSAKYSVAATSPLAYGGAPIYFTNPLPQVFQDQIEFDDSNTLDLPFKRVLGSYGYFGGGAPTSSIVDRIDYSNDTQLSLKRNVITSRAELAATGNSNFGYFGGGSPGPLSRVERLDYSNDTSFANSRNPLILSTYGLAASGNYNFGYFSGGVSTGQRIDRINYSNDNIALVNRGSLTFAAFYISATGNSNFGYFGGGISPGPINYTNIARINYANDLIKASARGPLTLARYGTGATGNSNFGYFGGGLSSGGLGSRSTLDRIDYSNDTATTSVRGPLSYTAIGSSATGNSNFGYFRTNVISNMLRIDYLNDTETTSIRGASSTKTYSAASTNARNS
jgi:hypothetical protein